MRGLRHYIRHIKSPARPFGFVDPGGVDSWRLQEWREGVQVEGIPLLPNISGCFEVLRSLGSALRCERDGFARLKRALEKKVV